MYIYMCLDWVMKAYHDVSNATFTHENTIIKLKKVLASEIPMVW